MKVRLFTILGWLIFSPLLLAQPESASDTTKPPQTVSFTDSTLHLSLKLFTSNQTISAEDADNLIAQDFSDYLQRFRSLDITRIGSNSQTRSLNIFGAPSGSSGIYSGDFFFNPPGLSVPFQNKGELNLIPIENIKSVRLVENPLLNLILADSKMGGIYLEEKDYAGGEPYSRLTFGQGIWGYRRTQVELGRGFVKKLRFYGTLGLHKYNGEFPGNQQDLDFYSFKLSYDLDSKTRLIASSQIHAGKRGVVSFPGLEAESLKIKQSFQKFNLSLYRQMFRENVIKAGFDFARVKQELKPVKWESIDKVYGLRLELYPQKLGRNNTKLSWNVYNYDYQDESKRSMVKDNFSLTNLLQISPKLWWLAWGNFEGLDSTGEFVTNRKFSFLTGLAWQADSSFRLYASGGRINSYPGLKDFYSPARTLFSDTVPIYSESGNLSLRSGYHWYLQSGLDWESKKLKLGSYYFYSNSKRAVIVSRQDTLLYGYWSPQNVDIQTHGANFYFDFHPGSAFTFYTNFNYKNWEKGRQPYLPKSSSYSFVELNQEFFRNQLGWKIRIEGEYLGPRFDEDKAPLDEVLVLNAKVGFRILAVNFYFAVKNLTNQTYRSGSQFNQPEKNNWWGLYWEFFD